jgi:membrane protease YdiL (CAAX protease family)
MLGNLLILLLSWALLRLIEKKNLPAALGLSPTRQRIKDLAIGLLLTIPFSIAFWLTVSWLVQNPYHLQPGYRPQHLLTAAAWLANSVLYEDLLFRGALLYILIQRIGPRPAILTSAIAFGIYHWFSYGMLGQPVSMLITFLTTGLAGYLMAVAFNTTGSIYLSFGLHFGIDFASMVIFSQSKAIGLQLLIKTYATDPVSPGAVISLLIYTIHFAWFPLLSGWYLLLRQSRQPSPKNRPD